MRVGVLGPVAAWDGDEPVVLGRPMERALLALLALRAGRTVSAEAIVDALWGDDPPPAVRDSLKAHVSRLRRSLGPHGDLVVTAPSGYSLALGPEAVDASAFELELALAREHRLADDAAGAATVLRAALARWRGETLAGLSQPFAAPAAERLHQLRLVAEEDLLDADLACGRHEEVLGRTADLIAAEPYRERLWAARIVALHRAGAPAAAVDAYQALRRTLADDLGLEPSDALRDLERRVLDRDPALDLAPAKPAAVDRPATDQRETRSTPPAPTVRYATAEDGVHVAWQEAGSGPPLVWVPSHLWQIEVAWEHPACADFLRTLAADHRLLMFDKRGQGLSDRVRLTDLASRARDIPAVLDAAGVDEPAVVFGSSDGAAIAANFAAEHPQRIRGLFVATAGLSLGPHRSWSFDVDGYRQWAAWLATRWGTGRSLGALAPSVADDPAARAWYGRMERQSMGPGELVQLTELNAAIDWEDAARRVRCPTLVIHRRDEIVPVAASEEVAAAIPGAHLHLVDGVDHLVWFGDTAPILDALAAFESGLPAHRVAWSG